MDLSRSTLAADAKEASLDPGREPTTYSGTGLCICFSSVQLLSHVWLFETPWAAARQASLSITNSRSLLKLMSIESVMPSSHLILCRPLLFPPWVFPSIRVFSNESVLRIRWPEYWSFGFSISPSSEYSGLTSFSPVSFEFVFLTQKLFWVGCYDLRDSIQGRAWNTVANI